VLVFPGEIAAQAINDNPAELLLLHYIRVRTREFIGFTQCSAQAVQHRLRGARACLVGLSSTFQIRKEGSLGRKENRIRLPKAFVIYNYSTVLNVID
jgi:hypothetical protein